MQVQEIRKVEEELKAKRQELGEVEKKWEERRGVMESWKKGKRELEVQGHRVGLLEEQVEGSNAARVRLLLLSVL